jgi:flavin-dependent dehydrogenase
MVTTARYDGNGTVVGVTVRRRQQNSPDHICTTDVQARSVLFAEGSRGVASEVCTSNTFVPAPCLQSAYFCTQ